MARCPSRIALLIEASQPTALPAAHVAGLSESGRRFLTLLERRGRLTSQSAGMRSGARPFLTLLERHGRLTLSEAIERMDIPS